METFKLCVNVLSGHHLLPMDGQGSASSFVVLNFQSQQFRTSTKFKDVNPVWDESFYFDVSTQPNWLGLYEPYVLEASVYCVNNFVQGSRSPIGTIKVSGFSPNHVDTFANYYTLQRNGVFSLGVTGELLLKVYMIYECNIRAQEPRIVSLHSAATRLCVEVVSAHGLMPKNEQGSTTTCVELTFDYYQFRTTIKEKDLNPVWNERFYFNVWDPTSVHDLDIKACVYHIDGSFEHSKTLLGTVRVAGASWGAFSDAFVTQCPLEKFGVFSRVKGHLRLKVYTIDDPSITTSNPSLQIDSVRAQDPICPPQLHVSSNLESIQSSRPQALPLQYLKEITNNFTDERILGHGGFGVVYKGVLQNGEMIAVKKIMPLFVPGRKNQFENEVYHLISLKHPNIVRFIGYCYETQNACLEYNGKHIFAEATERLLCLEYLPNGSLDKYLSDESSGLNWSTRYKIIEGICYGLCHLHEHDKPIIHLDLKPANILLDDDMVPKLTDFGLSRLLDQQQTICTSSCDGTFGYMAPEFLHGGTITPKSDIFSLGVIIMEVITGHRDYPDVTRASSDDYIELALTKWRDVLQRPPGYESLETDCEQIKRCIQIGLICVNHDRKKRPPIMKVISMLQGLDIIDCDIINEEA